jgi:hypothetical protein
MASKLSDYRIGRKEITSCCLQGRFLNFGHDGGLLDVNFEFGGRCLWNRGCLLVWGSSWADCPGTDS